MKNTFFLMLLCSVIGLGQIQASWFADCPRISKDSSDERHIFRGSTGHFSEDTPENRAFIEAAAESLDYRAGTNNFGAEIYLRTMPNGRQAWAEVREGVIRNGGFNSFPKEWVPDSSARGGHYITPKFELFNLNDSAFKGAITINRLVMQNGFINPLSPSHWGTRKVVQGVEGQYGKILDFVDSTQKRGTHKFFLPLEVVTHQEALQVLREVAQGIYVYDAVPIFSLHFNRSMDQYPILYPHYRKTLVGEAISMLDYWMKSAINGRYFDSDFIYSWEDNRQPSRSYLMKNSHSFHEYCECLGVSYRSLFDIVEEMRENFDVTTTNSNKLSAEFRIVAFQKHIWRREGALSFEPGIKIETSFDNTQEQFPGFDLKKAACDQMCSELEVVLPQISHLKRYFEILHLANFFSYYCQTMKEYGLIPLMDRNLKNNQCEFRGCPNLFPPVPFSMKDMEEVKFVDFLEYLEETTSFQLEQLMEVPSERIKETFHLALQDYLNVEQDIREFSDAIYQHCREKFSKTKKEYDWCIQDIGIIGDTSNPEVQRRYINRLDRIIRETEGEDRSDMQILKKYTQEWFENPCLYAFKNTGMKSNIKNGNYFPINHCSSEDIQFGGGCGFPIHLDMIAEENPQIAELNQMEIEIPYSEMEIEQWDDPKEVAKGYLFPPLPDYPLKDSIFRLLCAISHEDQAVFDQKKGDLWMWEWNYCDPLGRFFVHHAAAAKTDYFLKHMISRWAKLDQKDPMGWTPLHYAASYGSTACIDTLLYQQSDLLEKEGDNGETPLFVAVQEGQREAVLALLDHGANPNCKIYLDLDALMWSILSKKEVIAEILLNRPQIDLSSLTTKGETVVELAIQSQSLPVLKRLLDLVGVNINRYHNGMTPLHLAAALGWHEGVELLLSHPLVDADLPTADGRSYRELAECLR